MADIHKDRVIASNQSLWASQMYSDLKINCGSDEYKVHRSIICPRSTFFAAACKGDFIEAKTATITMNDDDPQTVKRMLLYLYTLDYADNDVSDIPADNLAMDHSPPPDLQCETSTTTGEEADSETALDLIEGTAPHDARMMNNILVYAAADKYDIPELKELAKLKFQALAISNWPHNDFDTIVRVIFSTTPNGDMGLRQVILDLCEKHFQDILKDRESRASLLDNSAVAAVVLGAAIRKMDRDDVLLDEAFAKQIAMKDTLSKVKADAKEASDQRKSWDSQLNSMIDKVKKVHECRHCHESFHGYIERVDTISGPGIQLRCKSCSTKHKL